MSGKPLGDRGEEIAARHLEGAGWRILHRNYRAGRREIDLVATRGGVVAFVEVKTRRGLGFGHPLEAVTAAKRRRIREAALAWIEAHGRPGLAYRFDAVSVLVPRAGPPEVEHVEGAWEGTG